MSSIYCEFCGSNQTRITVNTNADKIYVNYEIIIDCLNCNSNDKEFLYKSFINKLYN